LFLPVIYVIYILTHVSKFSLVTRNAFLDVADVFPIVLMPFFAGKPYAEIFLIGCTFANVLMRPSVMLGGALYLLTYGFAGISVIVEYWGLFSFTKFCIAFALILVPLIAALFKMKNNIFKMIGASLYAIIALVPCLYSVFFLKVPYESFGFLCLVLGDLTLILVILNVITKPWFHCLSNCIFYTGVVLTPLALQF
jgi:hypothetical protein